MAKQSTSLLLLSRILDNILYTHSNLYVPSKQLRFIPTQQQRVRYNETVDTEEREEEEEEDDQVICSRWGMDSVPVVPDLSTKLFQHNNNFSTECPLSVQSMLLAGWLAAASAGTHNTT